jgi:hypothetical protein
VNKKVTPEIERFIQSNCKLTSTALSGLIENKFDIKISYRAIDPYLKRFLSEAEAENNAKVEAVRSKILGDADAYAEKYLRYMDEEIEEWKKILKEGKQTFPDGRKIEVKTVKARSEASTSLHKFIISIIEFAKPHEQNPNININLPESLTERMKKYEKYYEQMDATTKGAPGRDST